jgi:hypothetical protein
LEPKEFIGGELTTAVLKDVRNSQEPIALVLSRSTVLRLYILPWSWASRVEGHYGKGSVAKAQRVSLEDLRTESVTGRLIMEQTFAVVKVGRGFDANLIVPAFKCWRDLVEPEESDGS